MASSRSFSSSFSSATIFPVVNFDLLSVVTFSPNLLEFILHLPVFRIHFYQLIFDKRQAFDFAACFFDLRSWSFQPQTPSAEPSAPVLRSERESD